MLKNESDVKIKMFDDWIGKCKDKLPKEVVKKSDATDDVTTNVKPSAPPTIKYLHNLP
jgi:hypothetical protein